MTVRRPRSPQAVSIERVAFSKPVRSPCAIPDVALLFCYVPVAPRCDPRRLKGRFEKLTGMMRGLVVTLCSSDWCQTWLSGYHTRTKRALCSLVSARLIPRILLRGSRLDEIQKGGRHEPGAVISAVHEAMHALTALTVYILYPLV